MTPKELAELDLAVAKAEGWKKSPSGDGWYDAAGNYIGHAEDEAMRLLEKYGFTVHRSGNTGLWYACKHRNFDYEIGGPTPAIAICRAVIALKEPT